MCKPILGRDIPTIIREAPIKGLSLLRYNLQYIAISPGRKTFVQLVEEKGSYKMVCFLADSLPGEHILATYSHTIFKPVASVEKVFGKIIEIGTTQHFAITDGDHRRELEILADIMDFEYHEIN